MIQVFFSGMRVATHCTIVKFILQLFWDTTKTIYMMRNLMCSSDKAIVISFAFFGWFWPANNPGLKLYDGMLIFRHVFYCMKYVNMLVSHGVRPILVFDGCHLPSKEEVEKQRRE